MFRELVILAACPAELKYAWENYIFLNNLRERGLSDKAQILIFIASGQIGTELPEMWRQLESDFPEVGFFYYKDKADYGMSIKRLMDIFKYVPLLRPYCLSQHFKAYPELSKKAVLYTDSDILILPRFNISQFLDNDVCYLSQAGSYTNSEYFDTRCSKLDEETGVPISVEPSKWEAFLKRDVLNECAKICGITRQDVEAHKEKSGAAQYLLKNIDHTFWNNVFDACIEIKLHLSGINQEYMKGNTPQDREDNGFQSWCADIWAVQFTLYKRKYHVSTPEEFNFAWATDRIEALETNGFYHNAGITGDEKIRRREDKITIEGPAFFKGKPEYNNGSLTPFSPQEQHYLFKILTNPTSKQYAFHKYVEEIIKVKYLYNL